MTQPHFVRSTANQCYARPQPYYRLTPRWLWLLAGVISCWAGMATRGYGDIAPKDSIGAEGVNALVLHQPPYNLLGRKIAIGQLEIGRPGQFGIDKAVAQNWSVTIAQVFFRNNPAKVNTNVDPHAQNVASIMVGNDKAMRGVAPGARLYASAVGVIKRSGQPEECVSAQHLALQNGGDLRAINLSFGESLREDPRPNAVLDGNALLTQCLDWSARVHDVLYVVAGNQGKGGIPIPTDNYNGINVAFTTRVKGIFAKVDFANLGDPASSSSATRIIGLENNVGSRRAIGLVAPGSNVSVINPDGQVTKGSGTSFATPHITASVALLQEWGDRQLRTRQLQWSVNSRRHEVMKAVLLNSADKIQDSGDGLNLGMSRTIIDKANRTWLESDAYTSPAIPLNVQMGAGQLNVLRAYQQFSPGEWKADSPIPPVGWDYNSVSLEPEANQSARAFQDYVLAQPLRQGSAVSVTLAWTRRVILEDENQNDAYDLGERFNDQGLNNLDIYLLPVDSNDVGQAVAASISPVDSVEHIFARIPATGRYKIRVQFRQKVNESQQLYALAWWTAPVP